MAHLESLNLGFLCVVFQDEVLESLEVQRCCEASDIIKPHSHHSVVQDIKKTVFLMLLKVTQPYFVILFGLFRNVGAYLLSVGDYCSRNRASE